MSKPDPKTFGHEFRNALGQFATGVTIVTTMDGEQKPVGVTASSFNSVSLDPPLILWSLAKTAHSMPAYQKSGGFNVHVLASHQDSLSNQFARPSDDKFVGVEWGPCADGFPLLPEYAALFRCKTSFQYEGGDHIIFVGEVIDFERNELPPLLFHSGRYADTKVKDLDIPTDPGVDLADASFTENFLLYLISRAHFQTSNPVRQAAQDIGLSETEYFCISILTMNGELYQQEVISRLEHTGHIPDADIFARLERKALIKRSGDKVAIAEQGRNIFVEFLSLSKSLDEQIKKHFTPEEVASATKFLQKIIDITGTDIPELW
ncbi:MAG: flavin reductase [Hellea sp.]|nr:flavin reductase [Hellea sp.]